MPRLGYADDLISLLPRDMPCWLVLDRLPDTLQQLYSLEEAPDYVPLYANTRYAGHLEYSPLLVRADQPHSPLWQAFVEGLGERPLRGVVVTAAATQEDILAHLRQRLEARFYGQRHGLLRFYDPWIAAHLFSHASPGSTWLGPLERVVWHGGTFEQRAASGATWYAWHVDAEEPFPSPPPSSPSPAQDSIALTPAQASALERYAARWPLWQQCTERHGFQDISREHVSRFIDACQEAEHLSLPHEQRFDYLTWRFDAPDAPWPENIFDIPVAERMASVTMHVEHQEPDRRDERTRSDLHQAHEAAEGSQAAQFLLDEWMNERRES